MTAHGITPSTKRLASVSQTVSHSFAQEARSGIAASADASGSRSTQILRSGMSTSSSHEAIEHSYLVKSGDETSPDFEKRILAEN